MKKLIIAVAIVCAAAISQGSACAWTSYAYDAGGENDLVGGTYWLVSLGASNIGLADLVVNNDGTYDFGEYSVIATDRINAGTYGQIGGSIENLSAANNGDFYALVVVDASNTFFGKAAGVVDGIIDDPPTDATTIGFDNTGMGYCMVLADTATQAIPEPTSGLLMLLGMAGLALRRRRA